MALGSDFEASDWEEVQELAFKSLDCYRKEPIDSERVQRCKKCRRVKYGHPKPFGEKPIELKIIEKDDELRVDDEEKNSKHFKNREKKRKHTDEADKLENDN